MAAIPLIPLSVCFFDPVPANILRPEQRKFPLKGPIQTRHVNSFPEFWQSGVERPVAGIARIQGLPQELPPGCCILLQDSRSMQAPEPAHELRRVCGTSR